MSLSAAILGDFGAALAHLTDGEFFAALGVFLFAACSLVAISLARSSRAELPASVRPAGDRDENAA
ncbi:MAG: hypothetical protein ACREQY_18225 [Candidatus Binatia bacterium]